MCCLLWAVNNRTNVSKEAVVAAVGEDRFTLPPAAAAYALDAVRGSRVVCALGLPALPGGSRSGQPAPPAPRARRAPPVAPPASPRCCKPAPFFAPRPAPQMRAKMSGSKMSEAGAEVVDGGRKVVYRDLLRERTQALAATEHPNITWAEAPAQ